jgi:hypothetical protein
MHYAILFFTPPADRDALSYAEDLLVSESEGLLGPPRPEIEARKQELARAIRARFPRLEPQTLDVQRIARQERITLAEARERNRHLELIDPAVSGGLRVTLSDDAVWVTLPDRAQVPRPRALWQQAWELVGLLSGLGLRGYDLQLGRLLEVPRDSEAAAARYLERERAGGATRRWWKFW